MRERPNRKTLRYRGYDYRAPCSVHVTLCTPHRQRLFGTATFDGIQLNDAGRFVEASLLSLGSERKGIGIDTHIVMPDHLHAIIVLGTEAKAQMEMSIPDVVRLFKMRVMKSWPRGVRLGGWEPYDGQLWQRSYDDTLIRNDRHLKTTRAYILDNPRRWIERPQP